MRELLEAVLAGTPDGETQDRVARAVRLSFEKPVAQAVALLGTGSEVLVNLLCVKFGEDVTNDDCHSVAADQPR